MWIDIIRSIEDRRKNGNELSYLNTNIDSHLGYYIILLLGHIFDFKLIDDNIKIYDKLNNTNIENSFLIFYIQTHLIRELTLEKNNCERDYQGILNNIQYITCANNMNQNIMDVNNDISRLNELLKMNKNHIKNINNLIKLINNKFNNKRSIVNLIESIRDIKKYL